MEFLIVGLMAIVFLCTLKIVYSLDDVVEQQKKSNEFLNSIESDLIDIATEIRTK